MTGSADTAPIDLKALLTLPYGQAQQALIAAGAWDPHADGSAARYRVTIQASIALETEVDVEARSPEEAIEKAETEAMEARIHTWAIDGWEIEGRPDIEHSRARALGTAPLPPGEA